MTGIISTSATSPCPFVCGCRNLGEAPAPHRRRRGYDPHQGEPGTGNVVEAVRHCRQVMDEIRVLCSSPEAEVPNFAGRKRRSPWKSAWPCEGRPPACGELCRRRHRHPADAAMMMHLGCDGVFVAPASSSPAIRAACPRHQQGCDQLQGLCPWPRSPATLGWKPWWASISPPSCRRTHAGERGW